jgi:hypothetical protein
MGITWLFGFMLIFPGMDEGVRLAFATLFCIFNSLQGFLIFVVYIVLSKSRRRYISFTAAEKYRKFKNKHTQNSGTHTVSTTRESKITDSETIK